MGESIGFMLAKDYIDGMKIPRKLGKRPPPLGWWMSEKLDGYRAIFSTSHRQFLSRNNKAYNAPKWLTDLLPEVDLDGELYTGRDNFEKMGIVRKKVPVDDEWIRVRFHIFDAPSHPGTFRERHIYLRNILEVLQAHWNTIRATLDKKFHNLDCPVGVGVAVVGTAGYYGYKKMKGGTGKFKKNEKILYIQNDGSTYQAKFRRYISPNKATIKLLSRKALTPLITVNTKKLRTIKKTIMNTRKRQKNRRADTVKRKRNIKLKKNKTDELSRLFSGLFK